MKNTENAKTVEALHTHTHTHGILEDKTYILLTGTIDASKFGNTNVKVIDCGERLSQYENAITRYIKESVFDNIVFIENSGYDFQYGKFNDLANRYNKTFEFISVDTDIDKTKELGKSYGEAILIKRGIEESKLLKNAKYIYKVTGRIFLENSKQICKKKRNESEFIVFNKSKWCNTSFFKVTRKDFDEILKNAYMYCNETKGKDIESVYFDLLINAKARVKAFNRYPKLTGVVGTTGNRYDRSILKLFIKNILLKFGFFTLNNHGWGI